MKFKSPHRKAQAKAKAAGSTFFKGIVCLHHPELKGQRRTNNASCPQCVRDRMRRYMHTDPKGYIRKKVAERRRREAMKAAGIWVDLRKQKKAPSAVSARGRSAESPTRGGVSSNAR